MSLEHGHVEGAHMKRVADGLLLALAAGGVACSSAPAEGEPRTSEEPAGGAALTGHWSCIDEPRPPPPDNYPEEVQYVFPLVDVLTNTPLHGWTVYVCGIGDLTCVSPSPPTFDLIGTEQVVAVKVPADRGVFLEIEVAGYFPASLVLDGALYADQRGPTVEMYSWAAVQALGEQAQVPVEPQLGLLSIRGFDCDGNVAVGASYVLNESTDTSSVPFTFADGMFGTSLPPPFADAATLQRARSGDKFMNVPPGFVFASGILPDSNTLFGSATAMVRTGRVTNAEMRVRH